MAREAMEKRIGSHMNITEDNTYFDNTNCYLKMYEKNQGLIEKYMDIINQNKRRRGDLENFVFADYGTADGKMVMPTFAKLIRSVMKQLGNEIEIEVVFEDQEKNNCNILMQNIQGFRKDIGSIICLASGTSMYNRCMLGNSIDFGICVLALQWLSNRPSFFSKGALYSDATQEELSIFKKQSRDDLYRFLALRLQELKPGGVMFICCPTTSDKEHTFGSLQFNDSFTKSLRTLKEQQLITEEEFLHINFFFMPRVKKDFDDAFKQCKNDKMNFSIEDFKITREEIIPPLNDMEKQDLQKLAWQRGILIAFVKVIFYNTIYDGLSISRSEENKADICNAYFKIFEEILPDYACHFTISTANFFICKHG